MLTGWLTGSTRRLGRRIAVAGTALAMAASAAAAVPHTAVAAAQPACPWLNQKLPVSQRVNMLLPKMTLTDKVDLLSLDNLLGYQNISPDDSGVPQLCIPALTLSDGPSGNILGPAGTTTQLPAEIAVAATWNRSLARQYGAVLGSEAATKGNDLAQAPELDIDRQPQWGRTFETLGEDPYLTGQLGVADIAGIHSQGTGVDLKHFASYNQETNRNTTSDDAIVSDRTLHEIYLPAFQNAVTAGSADSVMCSYADINGQFACQNPGLVTGVLKDRWNFSGFVRSDLGAVHDTQAGLNAGTDVIKSDVSGQMEQLAESGQVSMPRLDDAVRRVLSTMFTLGDFNRPSPDSATANAATPAHDATAQTIAAQSTVLLKNDSGALPLHAGTAQSIAVIGADGGSAAITGGVGSGAVTPGSIVTPLQGITAAAGPAATVSFSDGSSLTDAAAAASAADVAVVFAGRSEGEGADLSSLSLPGNDDQLIETVAAANPNTIVVLNTGDPVTMPWLRSVRAVLEAWFPGQDDGTAIASVLFGSTDPGGKLPETFPQSLTQTPTDTAAQFPGVGGQVQYSEGLDVGYRGYDAENITPLFPFGFGLSYTTFAFSNLRISRSQVTNSRSTPAPSGCGCNGQGTSLVNVTATVTNTGSRTGSDVAQLYLGDPAASGEPPRQLKGFQRVTLRPGQATTVHFTLNAHDLSYWDDTASGWVLPDGGYQVWVGDSSAAASLPLSGSFTVTRSLGELYAAIAPLPAQLTPGTAVPVTATFTNNGDYRLNGAHASLHLPEGWHATPVTASGLAPLAPGQSESVTWSVTAPQQAQASTASISARLTFKPAGSSGGVRATATDASVTVAAAPPVQAGAVAPVVASAGQAVPVTIPLTNNTGRTVRVSYQVNLPASGVTVTPDHGSITVPPAGTSITLSAQTAGGSQELPVDLTATSGGTPIDLTPAVVPLLVPVGPLTAAFNEVAITSDADRAPGNIGDGANGDSLSADALAALGITPGSAITDRGITFTWPDVPSGTPDNAAGLGQAQTVTLSGSGSTLGFLGLGTNGTQSGTVTVVYTDGTTQQAPLAFPDWFTSAPASGDDVIATTPYLNSAVLGQRLIPASLFAAFVPLDPSRTVAAVLLPAGQASGGTMHIFAMAVGG